MLLEAEPPNGSTGFSAKRIVLHFDERVRLDRVRERLLISPPLPGPPEVTIARGTDVVIDLRTGLEPNTTYTFNIGEAVMDLSEGNVAAGLTYVVSTGPHLDSLVVQGRVVDALTGAPSTAVLVLLHDTADTAGVVRGIPDYFTRTDQAGLFRITHLRPGRFRITALRDQNADLRYDLPNEEIAFDTRPVDPTDTLSWPLFLFRPLATEQQVLEARVLPDRAWRTVMARPSPGLELHSLDRQGDPLTWWPQWNARRDTVVLWPSDTTLLADQRFTVSEGGLVLDTLTYRVTQKMPFHLTAQVITNTRDRTQTLRSSRPLVKVRPEHIRLRSDTVDLPFTATIDSLDLRTVRLTTPLTIGRTAMLELLPKALTDRYGGTNDTLLLPMGTPPASSFGTLRIRLKGDSTWVVPGPFILQLLDAQGGVAREAHFPSLPYTVDWRLVSPATYTLRVIDDRNGDGTWTTGSFVAAIPPERTYPHGGPITVRANWEVEVEWTLVR